MLKRWWRKFRGRDRGLFRFDDGARIRSVDPLTIAQRIAEHPTYNPARHLDAASRGEAEAQRAVADAMCDIFEVPEYDDQSGYGMTQAERISLAMAFELYLVALKKNTRPSVTSLPSMGSMPDGLNIKTTRSTSRSTSAGSAQASARPKSSASESSPAIPAK